jgi:hypothetical protein
MSMTRNDTQEFDYILKLGRHNILVKFCVSSRMACAGVAPIRSLVNVGNGVADLVFMPLEEYQRDQRVMRGYGQARYSL